MGRWHAGDRDILVVFDAGYDAPAYLLEGVPVEVLGSTTPVNSRHRRNIDPSGGRPPVRRPRSTPRPAVVVGHRPVGRGRRPALAGVPAQIRPGAHIQNDQTDAGLDPPEAPHRRGGGPVDLAGLRRPHPTPPRPATGRGSPPPLGEASRTRSAHPPPGSAAGSGTSARTLPCPTVRRNSTGPVPADRPARRTVTPPPVTTWAKRSGDPRPSPNVTRPDLERAFRREQPVQLRAVEAVPCSCTRRPRPHRPASPRGAAHPGRGKSTSAGPHAGARRRPGSSHLHPARRATPG
jgi:hypothetical protein